MTRKPSAFATFTSGFEAMFLARLGGTEGSMSISPVSSAEFLANAAGIGRKMTVLIFGSPRQ
jgi:hypothetical protein